MSKVSTLVYISRRAPTDDALIDDLTAVSQRNNARDGLSGVLLYDTRHFLQLLEGEHDALARCFLRIAQHPGHREVSILLLEETEFRAFSDWSMGFVDARGRNPSLAGHARRIQKADPADRGAFATDFFISAAGHTERV